MESTLASKCKEQQRKFDYRLDTDKCIIAHIDGRSFSKMVKKRFEQPFDSVFIEAMNETARLLCSQVQGAVFAYVQSDEISILIRKATPVSEVFFGGRMCKMQSIMASMATCAFNRIMSAHAISCALESNAINVYEIAAFIQKQPMYQFDCKVWTVDTENDAMAWFLHRNIDCMRNSKLQAAQTYLSHKEMMNRTSDEAIELLWDREHIRWEFYSDACKYGRLIVKEKKEMIGKTTIGSVHTVERNVWIVRDCFDLTDNDKRQKLFENLFSKSNNDEKC